MQQARASFEVVTKAIAALLSAPVLLPLTDGETMRVFSA